jgi:hypothetical protein
MHDEIDLVSHIAQKIPKHNFIQRSEASKHKKDRE